MTTSFREDNGRNRNNVFQNIRHIVMGILFSAMGVLMFVANKYDIKELLQFDQTFRYIFGGIFILYGAFRLYRGLKKDY